MTLPGWVAPQLATLVGAAPDGPDWVHEIKLDGYRVLARIERGRARLLTRNRQDWTERFPSVAEAAAALPVKEALLDGEIVALDRSGVSSFQALQQGAEETGDCTKTADARLFVLWPAKTPPGPIHSKSSARWFNGRSRMTLKKYEFRVDW